MEARHRHIPDLQSIRGLAAVAVLLHHSSFLFNTSEEFHYWAEALINAHAAVIVFFVLSGYVLARSLRNQTLDFESCTRFYVGRLFRLYPALWASCAVAVAYLLAFHFRTPTLQASGWYVRYYNAPPNVADIAKNVSLLGFALVPPTWSIRVELFASAAIPFISLAIRRGLGLGLLGGSTVLSIALQNTHQSRIVAFLLGNLGYLPCFVLGAVALRYQDRFGRLFGKPSALALSAAILLLFRRLDASWRFDVGYTAITPMLVESLAAAILIIGVVAHPIPLLQRRLVVRLGDISYSLYLIHFIVMSALAKLIGGLSINEDVRAMLLMMVTLAVCWPLSAISYSYIEKPGIWVGRMLANTLSGTYLRSRPRL